MSNSCMIRTALLVIAPMIGMGLPAVVHGQTIVVNTTTDAADLVPGDGICDNGAPSDLVNCSFRAAIEEANALTGADTIVFLINTTLVPPNFCDGGSGICGIVPDSALPTITDTVAIDGVTQPGAACGSMPGVRPLKIILSGSSAGVGANGLTVSSGASGSFIGGLNIQGFNGHGIELTGADNVHIACNNIGTNFSGLAATSNGEAGVNLTAGSDGNTIGTDGDGAGDAGEWNVISGNGTYGINVFESANTVIAQNLIGIGADGATSIGNGDIGVQLRGMGNRVGTNGDGVSDDLEFNVIAANGNHGVHVRDAGSLQNRISGNFVGTTPTLLAGRGNTGDGVRFGGGASIATVGTDLDGLADAAEGNTIASNGGAGVALVDGDNGRIAVNGNRIFANAGLGIDLNNNGATFNDEDDADVNGANAFQNYPDVTSAEVDGSDLGVTYTVDSDTANSKYPLIVEFFLADADNEEGRTLVGRDTFSVADWATCGTPPCEAVKVFSDAGVVAEEMLVATSTDSVGNTSEFSMPIEAVVSPLPIEGVVLAVKAFLEGPYASGAMSTALGDQAYLPLSQPFSLPAYDGTPLDYDSAQTVGALPDSTVDWVLVSLRTGTGPETEVAGSEFAALIFEGGTVASTGEDSLHFPSLEDGSYYLVLRSRNHLDAMSSSTISVSGGMGSWDFTTASAQAFGASPMKSLAGGSWGLFAADGNADGQVTAPDFNTWIAATTAGATGYQASDYNMDGQVTAPDFNLWIANTTAGAASKVPD